MTPIPEETPDTEPEIGPLVFERSEPIKDLVAAMASAQATIFSAKKNQTNPFFSSKYANLESIFKAVREPLAKHDLMITQEPTLQLKGNVYFLSVWRNKTEYKEPAILGIVSVKTTVAHKSGQFRASTMSAPVANAFDVQAVGSVISYLRRYAVAAILRVSTGEGEDDGEKIRRKADPEVQATQAEPKQIEPSARKALLASAMAKLKEFKFPDKSEVVKYLKELGFTAQSNSEGSIDWTKVPDECLKAIVNDGASVDPAAKDRDKLIANTRAKCATFKRPAEQILTAIEMAIGRQAPKTDKGLIAWTQLTDAELMSVCKLTIKDIEAVKPAEAGAV